MGLEDVAQINITIGQRAISRAGFGTPAIIAPSVPAGVSLVSSYTEDADFAAAGFSVNSFVRRMANVMFAAERRPPLVKVVHVPDTATAQRVVLTAGTLPPVGKVLTVVVQVDGSAPVTITRTIATTVLNTELAAIQTDIGAISGLSVTLSGSDLTITGTAGTRYLVSPAQDETNGPFWTMDQTHTTPAGIATGLAAANLQDSDWYGAVSVFSEAGEISAIAEWIEANDKLYLAQTSDADVATAVDSDVASAQQTATRMRTHVRFHPQMGAFAAASLLARQLSTTTGTSQWEFKVLPNVQTPYLTPTQTTNLRAKNVGYEVRERQVTASRGGKVAGGEWIDIIRLRDFIEVRLAENLYQAQLSNEKIPYTADGVSLVSSVIGGLLRTKVNQGLTENPAPSVTVPDVNQIAATVKRTRRLPNVRFNAQFDNAIILTEVEGNISFGEAA